MTEELGELLPVVWPKLALQKVSPSPGRAWGAVCLMLVGFLGLGGGAGLMRSHIHHICPEKQNSGCGNVEIKRFIKEEIAHEIMEAGKSQSYG